MLRRVLMSGCAFALLAGEVGAGSGMEVLLTSDESLPGGGEITSISSPLLNDAGRLAFTSIFDGTSIGLFMIAPGGSLTEIVRTGDAAPDGNGVFPSVGEGDLLLLGINDAGEVGFQTELQETKGGDDDDGTAFRSSPDGDLVVLIRDGDPAPVGDAIVESFTAMTFNGEGEIAADVDLDVPSLDDNGIFRARVGTDIAVVLDGQPAPEGAGSFDLPFDAIAGFNDEGIIAFRARITAPGEDGIFRGSGSTESLISIVRAGDMTPDGKGTFTDDFGAAAINDDARVAFAAEAVPVGKFTEFDGIYVGNGGALTEIARGGDEPPDGNGVFDALGEVVLLNNDGQVLFFAGLTDTKGGVSDDSGIFRDTIGSGVLIQIAREGEPAPGGDGVLSSFTSAAMNEAGDVAFLATLSTGAEAIFFYDDEEGLRPVARVSDSIAGSSILSLEFATGGPAMGDQATGLNASGQIAFAFSLLDGRQGLALWNPSLSLVGDVDGDGSVGFTDLIAVLHAWGPCPPPPAECVADVDGSGGVDFTDLLLVLDNWTV